MVTAAIPLAMAVTNPRAVSAIPDDAIQSKASSGLPLGENGYTDLGGLPMCRILNGMWQVSGSHGYQPLKEKAVAEMSHCAGNFSRRHHLEAANATTTISASHCKSTCPATRSFTHHLHRSHRIDEGFTTFDLADHYGPAEDYVGFFSKGRLSSSLSKECQVQLSIAHRKFLRCPTLFDVYLQIPLFTFLLN